MNFRRVASLFSTEKDLRRERAQSEVQLSPLTRRRMLTMIGHDRIIVGGAQAGLAVSCYLTREGRSRFVLEQPKKEA